MITKTYFPFVNSAIRNYIITKCYGIVEKSYNIKKTTIPKHLGILFAFRTAITIPLYTQYKLSSRHIPKRISKKH